MPVYLLRPMQHVKIQLQLSPKPFIILSPQISRVWLYVVPPENICPPSHILETLPVLWSFPGEAWDMWALLCDIWWSCVQWKKGTNRYILPPYSWTDFCEMQVCIGPLEDSLMKSSHQVCLIPSRVPVVKASSCIYSSIFLPLIAHPSLLLLWTVLNKFLPHAMLSRELV